MIYLLITAAIIIAFFKYSSVIVKQSHNRVIELCNERDEAYRVMEKLSNDLSEIKSQQQSKSVKLGLLAENVIPLKSDFPFDYKNLVPMFRPIDYVVFEENRIVFLEIKTGKSALSEKQKNIARLIREGKVEFVEYRISEEGINVKT